MVKYRRNFTSASFSSYYFSSPQICQVSVSGLLYILGILGIYHSNENNRIYSLGDTIRFCSAMAFTIGIIIVTFRTRMPNQRLMVSLYYAIYYWNTDAIHYRGHQQKTFQKRGEVRMWRHSANDVKINFALSKAWLRYVIHEKSI